MKFLGHVLYTGRMEDSHHSQEYSGILGISRLLPQVRQGFSKIAKPMTELLKKEKEFKWTPECEASFQELKLKLTSAPILIMPDINKNFEVYCDASRLGLGCVVMQEGKVVSYLSRQL